MTEPFEWGSDLPPLVGERLVLRPLTPIDVPALFGIFGDPEVVRFWSGAPLRDIGEAEALLSEIREGFAHRTLFQWGVEIKESASLIGTCSMYHLDMTHRRAEVGFAVASGQWGRGYGREAVGVLLEFLFKRLALHRLEADADPHNERSLRLLERHGFVREGYLRERWHVSGRIYDAVFLGLLRREWEALGFDKRESGATVSLP